MAGADAHGKGVYREYMTKTRMADTATTPSN
jgi:hypothetical protein